MSGYTRPSYCSQLTTFLESKRSAVPKYLIWAAGLTFLIYYTAVNCIPLLDDYNYNNVATQITIIKDEPNDKPEMALCLPYISGALTNIVNSMTRNDSKYLECQAMEDHGWNVWKDFPTYPNSIIAEAKLGVLIARKLLENEADMKRILTFNRSNFNWNEAIFHTVWRYFACQSIQDIKLTQDHNRFVYNVCREALETPPINSMSRETTDFLFQRMLEYLAMYLKIEVTYESDMRVAPENLMNRHRTFIMKGEHFCLAMRSEDDIFREGFKYVPFVDDVPPPWRRAGRTGSFLIFQDHSVLYDFVDESAAVYPTGRRTLLKAYEEAVLGYSLETRTIETRPNIACDNTSTTPNLCMVNRQLQKAMTYCGCVPFIYRHVRNGTERLPYCNHKLYERCRDRLLENLHSEKQECANKCMHSFYNWSPVGRANWQNDDESWDQAFRIDVTHLASPFVEFKITFKDSPEQFTAQLGGIVNLYLGVSGVGICAFIICCVEQIWQWFRSHCRGDLDTSGRPSTEHTATDKDDRRSNFPDNAFITRREVLAMFESLKKDIKHCSK